MPIAGGGFQEVLPWCSLSSLRWVKGLVDQEMYKDFSWCLRCKSSLNVHRSTEHLQMPFFFPRKEKGDYRAADKCWSLVMDLLFGVAVPVTHFYNDARVQFLFMVFFFLFIPCSRIIFKCWGYSCHPSGPGVNACKLKIPPGEKGSGRYVISGRDFYSENTNTTDAQSVFFSRRLFLNKIQQILSQF